MDCLKLLHEDTDIPVINSLMTMIRQCLEQEATASDLTDDLRENDIPFGMNLKPPLLYHKRTEEWLSEYNEKKGSQNKNDILIDMVWRLRKEGFRFVARDKKDDRWTVMSMESSVAMLNRRMHRLCEKAKEMKKNVEVLSEVQEPQISFPRRNWSASSKGNCVGL